MSDIGLAEVHIQTVKDASILENLLIHQVSTRLSDFRIATKELRKSLRNQDENSHNSEGIQATREDLEALATNMQADHISFQFQGGNGSLDCRSNDEGFRTTTLHLTTVDNRGRETHAAIVAGDVTSPLSYTLSEGKRTFHGVADPLQPHFSSQQLKFISAATHLANAALTLQYNHNSPKNTP